MNRSSEQNSMDTRRGFVGNHWSWNVMRAKTLYTTNIRDNLSTRFIAGYKHNVPNINPVTAEGFLPMNVRFLKRIKTKSIIVVSFSPVCLCVFFKYFPYVQHFSLRCTSCVLESNPREILHFAGNLSLGVNLRQIQSASWGK